MTSSSFTLWFTGLSGAGKSTLATAAGKKLGALGRRAEVLDGDLLRKDLCKDLGFSHEDREENIRRIAFVADALTRQGAIVLVAAISPYRKMRQEARDRIGRFFEVYVRASLELCEKRDPKGLYKRARAGEILHFTGISDPYEPPSRPDLVCDTEKESVRECVGKIIRFLEKSGALT